MKSMDELKKIAHDLVERREAPGPQKDQAFSTSVAGLALMDRYGKVPQLEDMDPHGFGLAPVDSAGRRIGLMVRPQSPFYVREKQLGVYDIILFVTLANDTVTFVGWLPDEVVSTMPVKQFANNSNPYMITGDLVNPMPALFDFDKGCDTLTCTKPALWLSSVEGWDCMVCDKVRFDEASRARHGVANSK